MDNSVTHTDDTPNFRHSLSKFRVRFFGSVERFSQDLKLALNRSLKHFIQEKGRVLNASGELLDRAARCERVKQPPLRFDVHR